MKKALSILLTLVMLLSIFSCVPVVARADDEIPTSGYCGTNVTWSYDVATGKLTLSGSGRTTSNRPGDFEDLKSLVKSIEIEAGVTTIGEKLFEDFINLKSVSIGPDVYAINLQAFAGCTSLGSIFIPEGVTYISHSALICCTSLSIIQVDVDNPVYDSRYHCNAIIEKKTNKLLLGCKNSTVPNSVTSIGQAAFLGCTGLTSIELPSSVTWISYYAFSECSNLKSIAIPSSVNEISNAAFSLCKSLESIVIPDSVTRIGYEAFKKCVNLKSINIPSSLETIEKNTFEGCSHLTDVTIGTGVKTIEKSAFKECYALNSVNYAGTQQQWDAINLNMVGNGPLFGCKQKSGTINGKLGDNLYYTYDTYFDKVTISGSGDYFEFLPSPFQGDSAIRAVEFEAGVEIVGDYCFDHCRVLSNLTLGPDITTIKEEAFANTALSDLYIPDKVERIYGTAFMHCKSLAAITVSEDNEEFDSRENCNAIITRKYNILVLGCRGTVIPRNVESIGSQAFYDCTGLTSIQLPKLLYSIGTGAFDGCTGLTSVSFPDWVAIIGSNAFANCTHLESVRLPNNCDKIGNYAFYRCTSLTNIDFTKTRFKSIGEFAFTGCTGLTTLKLSSNVTKIGKSAFADCDSLTDIYFDGSPEEWASVTIEYPKTNTPLTTATMHFAGGSCGENVKFSIDDASGTLTISGTGAMTDYTSGNAPWYGMRNSITAIVVEKGVTRIGNYAFDSMENVTSVTLADTVGYVGVGAFRFCNALQDVYFTGTMSQWESMSVTAYNTALLDAALHVSETGACGEHLTYSYNSDTGTLTIDGKGGMYSYADAYTPWYDYMESIQTIVIGDGVTSIGDYAFECTGITEINIPSSMRAIGNGAFAGCTALTSVAIPDSVSSIGQATFRGCTALTSVSLQSSLNSVENAAFYGCTALSDVYYGGKRSDWALLYIGSDNAPLENAQRHYGGTASGTCGESAYWSFNEANGTLTISGTGEMFDEKSPWSQYSKQVTQIVIENGITRIGTASFSNCSKATSIDIGKDVESIGPGCFGMYNKLTDVYYASSASDWAAITIEGTNEALRAANMHYTESYSCGENVTWSFDERTGTLTISGTGPMTNYETPEAVPWYGLRKDIQRIVVEDGVTSIGKWAFSAYTELRNITISDSVTNISDYAFHQCRSLKVVFYNGTQEDWDNIAIGEMNHYLTDAALRFPEIVTGACGENATYSLNRTTGVLTISGTGQMYDYDTDSPFADNAEIESVIIENGITTVGEWAFTGSSKIRTVTLPNTLSEIGEFAFRGCTLLRNIALPLSLTTLGNSAFFGCTSLYAVLLPNSLVELGERAFESCTTLYKVNIPASVTSFGRYAFRYCSGLGIVELEYGLETIGEGAFFQCTYLADMYIPSTVTIIGNRAFAGCTDLYRVNMSDAIATIGTGAFNNCSHLGKVGYGGTQEQWDAVDIGNQNQPLTDIRPKSSSGTCGEGVNWHYNPSTFTLTISGEGEMDAYDSGQSPFAGNERIAYIIIENGVYSIGSNAFEGCVNVREVYIGTDVNGIFNNAFGDCVNLGNVNYYGTQDDWDNIYFDKNNDPLTSAKPQSIFGSCGTYVRYKLTPDHELIIYGDGEMDNFTSTSMPWYDYRYDIERVVICDGVTDIGNNAFWNHKYIESVSLGGTVQSIGKYAFSGVELLQSIELPDSLTSIGVQAFGNCENLESVVIPSGVTSLATSTFASCENLTSVTLPTTLTKIGAAAFSQCHALQTVNYAGTEEDWNAVEILDTNDPLLAVKPQTGEIIRTGTCGEHVSYTLNETTGLLTISGMGAMYDYEFLDSPFNVNQKVKEIVIESGVTTVGDNVFTQLSKLETVRMPSTVTSLGEGAFAFCSTLSDINIPESVQSIGDSAFSACSLTSITIPKGVTTIGKSTFWYCDHLQSVTLPKSLESVADNAFVYCKVLTDVFYEGTASEWSVVTVSTTGNDPLLGATMHYGTTDFAAIHYKVPAFAGTNTTLTFKSDSMTLTVSATDGNFDKDNVQSGVYKVYAGQKNALTVYLGKYNTASGAVTNTGAITLPLGDVNKDEVIDIADISMLLSTANYGKHNSEIDLTGDGMITIDDISVALMATNYGLSSVKVV